MRPIGNLNFAGATILAELDYRNATFRIFGKIDQHFVGGERPRDHFVSGLRVVRKPKRACGARSGLLADLLSKNRIKVEVPIVFITASDDIALDRSAVDAGAVCLLRKPFSSDELLAAVDAALRNKSCDAS